MRRLLLAAAAALLASGCAFVPPEYHVNFEDGEKAACAFSQDGCTVWTRSQLHKFYSMAYEAGRQYQKGVEQGKKDAEVFPQPWQEPGFEQRDM